MSITFGILNKLKKIGIKKSSFDYFKKGYINELKYNFTNDNFKTTFYGEALFYGVNISEAEYLRIAEKITNDDIKNIANTVFDFTKIGVLTYGEYKNKTAMEKLITEQVGSYIMLQNDKYISS